MKKIRYKLRALPPSHPKYLRWLELFDKVSLLDYVATYTDEMEVEDNANHLDICEQLFEKFNLNHPSNYAAHSMSVSDIVEIIDDNKEYYYFCDDRGFVLLNDNPKFKGWKN